MKNFIYLLMLSFLFGCSTTKKIEALKPEPSINTPVVYNTTTSFVNMPMEVTLNDVEFQLNKSLNGLIYEDATMSDDKTEMKIWKTSSIQLKEINGKIQSVLPLKIWAKIKYGTEFMGLNDTREIEANGIITLLSDVSLSNFKMKTNSTIEDFTWSESPTILVAGKKVPITYILSPTLSIFKSKIAKKIDEAIDKSCDFKPYVLDVLETMSTPFEVNKEYESWFKIVPMEVYTTDAILKNNKVNLDLGLKCNMQTLVGQQPKTGFNKETILFKPVAKMPNKTTTTIAAVSTFESASRIITKNFQGKEFSSGSRKITINKVDLWHKDGKMIVALDMKGSVEGIFYLTGIPNYNSITKEIYFENLDYVLNSKGLLTKTANWLLQGVILKKIQDNCRYSIKENLESGKKSLMPYLNNYSPMKGVFVNGTIDELDFDKVEVNNQAIIAFIKGSGKMNVSINGME